MPVRTSERPRSTLYITQAKAKPSTSSTATDTAVITVVVTTSPHQMGSDSTVA